jgi:DNA repair exonuclease SbcCD ATPase subunit
MANEPGGLMVRLMRRAGYVPVARLRDLREKCNRLEQRNIELKQALEDQHDRADRTQQARAEQKIQERLEQLNQKSERALQRMREHDDARAARLEDLQKRTDWTEKSVQLGREHLMAIEVKLDIVEGAITVLDQRTRAALAAARGDHGQVRESVRLS